MKRCPECRRDYHDDSLLYCLEDGVALIQGSVPLPDEPTTMLLSDSSLRSDPGTLAQVQTTAAIGDVTSASSARRLPAKFVLAVASVVALIAIAFLGIRYFRAEAEINSIAVLPFSNDSGDPGSDYLSDGMTETLISSLSRLPALNVKPRSVVFRYKGKEPDPQSVGKDLGVQAILSGSVVSRGSDLSLFVELVDVSSVKVIWSQHYDRKQSDIVSLQNEIARDVSNRLKSGLSAEEEKKVTQTFTSNPDAYRLYLLGNSLAARRKTRDIQEALQDYQQAIALDPNYAPAYIGVATAETFMAIYGDAPGAEELPKARAAVTKALEIDPSSAEAHNILGGIELFLGRDFAASERETDRALELDPNLANGHRHKGLYLAWQGHFDEAITEFRRSLEIEPLGLATNLNFAWCLLYAGRIDESDAHLKSVQDIDPGFWFTEYQRFVNARAKNDHDAAVAHLARAQELRDLPDAAKFIRESYAKNGWEGFMRASIADPDRCRIWDYYLASFAAELGQKDKAFEFLNKAYDKYDQFILFLKIDHLMDPIRDDPRFAILEKKLGFPQ